LIHRTYSLAHDLITGTGPGSRPGHAFRDHARAEKKYAASPGGIFIILLQGLAVSTRPPLPFRRLNNAASADSKGKLLVVGI
jgi:hypothetical protein